MKKSHFKSYHYPRWPLARKTAACTGWFLLGIAVLFAPFGKGRWLGLIALLYCAARWSFSLYPQWKHVIRMNNDGLMIGSRSFKWEQFDQIQIERNKSGRKLRLTGQGNKHSLVIEDDLPSFDELARGCFFHINRVDEHPASSGILPKSVPKICANKF
jgi:hypothetical protein